MAAYVNTELKEEERAKFERILKLEAGLLEVGQSQALARAAKAHEVYTFSRQFPTEKAGNGCFLVGIEIVQILWQPARRQAQSRPRAVLVLRQRLQF